MDSKLLSPPETLLDRWLRRNNPARVAQAYADVYNLRPGSINELPPNAERRAPSACWPCRAPWAHRMVPLPSGSGPSASGSTLASASHARGTEMKETLWRALAAVLSHPPIARRIIAHAQRTPYVHLPGYMNRWWLFNPYQKADGEIIPRRGLRAWLPSIRVHEILRADTAEHMHDHPWDARTIILRGMYMEWMEDRPMPAMRATGDTRAIRYGEYHHISRVFDSSCFTLFFTWKYVGTWGFKVDGRKVPWREYLAEHPERE